MKSLKMRKVIPILKIQAILMTAMSHLFFKNLKVKRKRGNQTNKTKKFFKITTKRENKKPITFLKCNDDSNLDQISGVQISEAAF
jgi:hypothetical protein